ncbi:MAG: PH domain-containing protein [Actinomycetota bacterium]|nr:PH domain-containing protein [Actinomycetota bacterium]
MSELAPERRGRLHPLAVLVFARKRIGASILPILVVAFTWRGGFALPVLGVLVAVGLAVLVLEWRRFTYRIEAGRLVIERGVLRHTTRVVPLDRIRGVDLQAPWLHRVLGLVQVEVEAAAGGGSAAELTLAAVSAEEGERLRRALLSAGAREAATDDPRPARVLYRATPRLLVAGGLTSGRYILAPLAVIGVIANFADDLPSTLGDRLLSEAADRIPTEAFGVTALVAVGISVALVLAAAGSLLTDWSFELTDDGDRLVAQRGLLTRRTVAIDRSRVRGFDLRDSPLRRAFGLVGVRVVAGGVAGGRPGRTTMAPVIARNQVHELALALDPLAMPDATLERHPIAARPRRLTRAIVAPALLGIVALGLQWWLPAAILLLLAVAGAPLALDRYRQLGHRFDGSRLAVREGSLSRRWTSLDPRAVVSYGVQRSPFQARSGLCTIVLHLGQGAGSRRVLDCSEEQAAALLATLDVPLFAPFVPRSSIPVEVAA